MADFSRKIELPGRTADELYNKISSDLAKFLEKGSPVKAEITRNDAARTMEAKSSMFSAKLRCVEGCIQVDVKLGLLALPFKSKLDEGIDKWLRKAFDVGKS